MSNSNQNAMRNAVTGVLAATLLAGCASAIAKPRDAEGKAFERAQSLIAKGKADQAVPFAEQAVAANPRDAASRTLLGQAYLRAGRFESAAAAYSDAMSLGDNSSRSALALALAKIGAGDSQAAVGLLNDWRDSIPTSDLGLALALAGEPARGAAILMDALRNGENTPKLRQNLAYAYALDGQWREARLMAAQDVPADQIDARITQWAASGRAEDHQARVAQLLGTEVRSDPGMPVQLALNYSPAAEQFAAEVGAVPSERQNEQARAETELPPVESEAQPALAMATYAAETPAEIPAVPAEVAAPAPEAYAVSVPAPQSYATPFTAVAAFVSEPVIQPLPAGTAPAQVVPIRASKNRVVYAAPTRAAPAGGTHLVQLGSFLSQQGARRAWGIYAARNPELRNFRMTITQANVRGRNFWRVAAGGLAGASPAQGLCSTVKRNGGVCFAYAASRGVAPGRAAPVRDASGPQLARRR
jgi:Flp pilus assembly protein TadD